MIYVPLILVRKMERSLISLLTAMMKTHVLRIAAVNLLDNVNMILLTVKTTMLALLIPAVLHLVVNTNLWFAKIFLAIPSLVTLIMDVIMNVLSVMITISVP
jgi:hypothetical protein